MGSTTSKSSRRPYYVGCVVVLTVLLCGYVLNSRTFSSSDSPQILTYAQFQPHGAKLIPKIIWRTSKFPLASVPAEIREVLADTAAINPDYVQVYFDDEDVHEFVKKEYPQYLRAYESLVPGAYRADVFRLLVLHRHGGVYNDIGHQYLVPLSRILEYDDDFVASTEDNPQRSFSHAIHNSFLATHAGCPILASMVEQILEDVATCRYNDDPLDLSGPAAMGHAFNVWNKKQGNGPRGNGNVPDHIARGTHIVHGYKVKLLSHDAQNHLIKTERGGKGLISTKFKNYYEMLYKISTGRSEYDRLWRAQKVYNMSMTTCASTGISVRSSV